MPPTLPISEKTHAEKYRSPRESFEECMNRFAATLEDSPEHYHQIRGIIIPQRFLPAGRVQASVGSSKKITALNCFASGRINDNFVSGVGDNTFFKEGGIMARAAEAAQTMRMGGGIGFNFSHLRPRGDLIQSSQSRSSGPVAFMYIYDGTCRATMSAGHRRGAMMGVLNVEHPDSEEFIHCKQNTNTLTGFNLSIGITDEFMIAVRDGTDFDLRWGGRVYKTIDARILWEAIMRSTWDWAEPGVIFLDTINRMNPLWYCEDIDTTNPCAEQPLPPYGACLLGSFNLVKYLYRDLGKYKFDWQMFIHDIPPIIRAMDNVIDNTIYPLKEQEFEAKQKRRMGIGVTALANTIEAMGHPYGSQEFVKIEGKILQTLMNNCYQASAYLAKEKGSFPLLNKEKYLSGPFIKTLSKKTRDLIFRYGIRNSHLTSIAPTGTISLCADNVSSGIEPVFEYSTERAILGFDSPEIYTITDYGYRELNVKGKTSSECTARDHLAVLIEASKYVDSAVSKTCNINPSMPWEDFKSIYVRAWEGGCKGCTTFNPGGKRMGILTASEDSPLSCEYDPETGMRSCE